MPLRSPCTKTAVSRHHQLRKRTRTLENWKEKYLLRSSDDINHVEAVTSEKTSISKSIEVSLDNSTIIDNKIKAAGTGTSTGEILLPESTHLNGRYFSMQYQSGWYEHVC
jgi:hypothetical protein